MRDTKPSYLFFDIETTGLSRNSAVLEFGGLICNSNLGLIEVVNEYYKYSGEISESALAVNGLTPIKLEMFSNGDWLAGADKVFNLLTMPDITLCGHNIVNFDLPVLKNALEEAGYCLNLNKLKVADTLKMCRDAFPDDRKHNLAVSIDKVLHLMNSDLKAMKKAYSSIDLIVDKMYDEDTFFHNAVFDSFCTYIIYTYLRNM